MEEEYSEYEAEEDDEGEEEEEEEQQEEKDQQEDWQFRDDIIQIPDRIVDDGVG